MPEQVPIDMRATNGESLVTATSTVPEPMTPCLGRVLPLGTTGPSATGPSEAAHNETSGRNNDILRLTAMAADRYSVSNRAVAAIVNAFQMDVGRVTSEDESLLVAPKKIWRARNQARKELTKEAAEAVTEPGLTSLYFDGRKDKTCADYTSATETEEHVVVLSEPDSL